VNSNELLGNIFSGFTREESTKMAFLLHWVDMVIFGLTLLGPLCIGLYHACTGDKQRTTEEYIHGNRQIGLIPMTISMMVTYMSTLQVIGFPTEIVVHGAQYYTGNLGVIIGAILAVITFVPIFYPLKITSVNEYLEWRYGSPVPKYIANFCIVLIHVVYLGNIFYGAAVSMEAVSGFPTWVSIIICSTVSIIYTTIGGFKAVVWSDVFQALLMLIGLLAVCIQGLIVLGGFSNMWNIAGEWGRLEFFDFDPDPTKRVNFYGVVFGNALSYMAIYGHIQNAVQRYVTLPSKTQANICVLGLIPGHIIITTLSCLTGLIAFSYYADTGCDPKNAGHIRSYNQILPYFVADILNIPGVPGIFLAGLIAAALSSASSSLNGTTTQVWAEVIKPMCPRIPEHRAALIMKLSVMTHGCLSILMAMFFDKFGGTMIQIVMTIVSSISGPNAAFFFMGGFIPWVNWKGVSLGSAMGLVFILWVAFGAMFTPKNWEMLPNPDNCIDITEALDNIIQNSTSTIAGTTVSLGLTSESTNPVAITGIQRLYSISFLWMKELGTIVSILLSIFFSLIFGLRSPETIPHNLMHPIVSRFVQLSPKSVHSKSRENLYTEIKKQFDHDPENEVPTTEL